MFMLVGIPLAIALIFVSVFITITQKAVLFSKITFAVFAAITANGSSPIVAGGGFVSFLVWFAIFMLGCLLLCLAPRINFAFLFFCNSVITHIMAALAAAICCPVFIENYEPTLLAEIVMKLVCIVISAFVLIRQISSTEGIKGVHNKFLVVIERIIASIIYAIAFVFLFCVSMNNLYEFSLFLIILIFGIAFGLMYILDVILFERIRAFGNTLTPLSLAHDGNVDLLGGLFGGVDQKEIDNELREWEVHARQEREKEEQWHREWMDRGRD